MPRRFGGLSAQEALHLDQGLLGRVVKVSRGDQTQQCGGDAGGVVRRTRHLQLEGDDTVGCAACGDGEDRVVAVKVA